MTVRAAIKTLDRNREGHYSARILVCRFESTPPLQCNSLSWSALRLCEIRSCGDLDHLSDGQIDLALIDVQECDQECLRTAFAKLRHHRICVVALCPLDDSSAGFEDLDWDGVVLNSGGQGQIVALHCAFRLWQSRKQLEQRVEELDQKLEETRLVGRAKAIMAEQLGVSEKAALDHLRREARKRRKPMHELAGVIIDAQEIISPKSEPTVASRSDAAPQKLAAPRPLTSRICRQQNVGASSGTISRDKNAVR